MVAARTGKVAAAPQSLAEVRGSSPCVLGTHLRPVHLPPQVHKHAQVSVSGRRKMFMDDSVQQARYAC